MFETEEKRREIQKEIERAQQLLADAHEVEVGEIPSRPDEEFTEGEELEKVCFDHFFGGTIAIEMTPSSLLFPAIDPMQKWLPYYYSFVRI